MPKMYQRIMMKAPAIRWDGRNLEEMTAFTGTGRINYDSRSERLLIQLDSWEEVHHGWWVIRYDDPAEGTILKLASASAFRRDWEEAALEKAFGTLAR